jgi:hypothetical protein
MYDPITIVPAFDPNDYESRIEQKFVFDTASKGLLLEWLDFHLARVKDTPNSAYSVSVW